MREEVLSRLVVSRETFKEIITDLSNVLPKNILDGSRNTIEVEIPKFGNNILIMLNRVEGKYIYSEDNNIDELIEVFSNPDIDTHIAKAIQNNTIVGVSADEETMSVKEILEYNVGAIESGLNLLTMQLKVGKLN